MLLVTTGQGKVRFNPNLYKEGKVCLSLLGTWAGPGWDAKHSTLLQVFVSIQSLIMVDSPMFNEPGWEKLMQTQEGMMASEAYSSNVRYGTLRYAMLEALTNPPAAFADVVEAHFSVKAPQILRQLDRWENAAPMGSEGPSKRGWAHAATVGVSGIFSNVSAVADDLRSLLSGDADAGSSRKRRRVAAAAAASGGGGASAAAAVPLDGGGSAGDAIEL